MTAPLTLLSILGGTSAEPAPAQPQAEDAALFAAALVSALQQLQAPVRVATIATPVTTQEGGTGGEPAEGEPAPEGEESQATVGELLVNTKVAVSDEAADVDAPVVVIESDSESHTAGTAIDVTSDEEARPDTAAPRCESGRGEKRGKSEERLAAPVPESAPEAEALLAQDGRARPDKPAEQCGILPQAKPERSGQGEALLREEVKPTADAPTRKRDLDPNGEGPARPAGRDQTRTAGKGTVLLGDWAPPPAAFTGWKAPVERTMQPAPKEMGKPKESESGHSSVDHNEPAPAPVSAPQPIIPPAVALPMATAPLVDHPAQAEESPVTRSQPVPLPAPAGMDVDVALESSNDAVRQAQVANARLAAHLAELVGDHNVTDFRVQLGRKMKVSEQGVAPGPSEGATVKLPAEPTEPVAPAVATPRMKAPSDGKSAPSEEPTNLTSPRPVKAERPLVIERQTVTANRLMDLSDEPRIAEPLRAARAAAGPIVPDLRKEIPAAAEPEKPTSPVGLEKPRAREERPSDSPAAASSLNPGRAEPLTSRSDVAGPRESREARNLPQEGSGNDRPAGSADRVTVQVSDSEGRQTRIRVSVLGDQVRAVIVPPDAESARQLEQRMDDLQTALARQGFASSKVSVQQAGENAVERSGMSLAGMAGGGEGKAASPGREQPAGEQRQGRGQREQQQHPGDGHRHPNGRSRDQEAEHRRRYRDA